MSIAGYFFLTRTLNMLYAPLMNRLKHIEINLPCRQTSFTVGADDHLANSFPSPEKLTPLVRGEHYPRTNYQFE
jgi:hypothetical protein